MALRCVAGKPASLDWDIPIVGALHRETNVPASTSQWEAVFARLGLKLTTEATGCCGMSGTFGHEARNQSHSRTIFEQSWAGKLKEKNEALATGYSCSTQEALCQPATAPSIGSCVGEYTRDPHGIANDYVAWWDSRIGIRLRLL